MTIEKEVLLRKLVEFSENADEYEEIGGMLIRRCKNLYLKINSIDPSDQDTLIKMKFEIDEISLSLKDHQSGNEPAHGKLSSKWVYYTSAYIFLVAIVFYSMFYLRIKDLTELGLNNGVEYEYLKYLLLSMLGAMFYFISTSMVKFSEPITRILLACFVPVLLLGVVFTFENGTLKFSGIQSLIFLLGYNINLMLLFLKKANEKMRQTIG